MTHQKTMRTIGKSLIFLTAILGGIFFAFASGAAHAATNLIANPLLQLATVNPAQPDNWNTDSWGTNTAQFNYPVAGVNGGKGANVTMASYTDGDAKWYFDPVPVTPGATYAFSDSYSSTVSTEIDAQFTLSDGTFSYVEIAVLPSTGGAWASTAQQVPVPSNAVSLTMLHLLQSVGSLTTTNFSLTSPSAVPPPSPTLAISPASLPGGTVGLPYSQTLTASTTATGTTNWSFSGTLPPGLSMGPVTGATATLKGTPALAGAYSFSIRAVNGSASSTNPYSIVIASSTPPDTTPPSVPTGVKVTGVTTSTVSLGWTASTDNVGVAGYQVFRNSIQVATTTAASFADKNLSASTTYLYAITAFDAARNVSQKSSGTVATTLSVPPPPPPTATSTLTVNVAENGGTATASNFVLTVKSGTSTLFNGSGTSSKSFVLNVGSAYAVTEATTSASSGYSIGLGANCSGTTGTSTAICAITNTFVPPPPPPLISISPISLPNGTAGLSYSQTLTASTTASAPFAWSIASGNLPSGLSLGTSTGKTDAISGTPSGSGSSTFAVAVTNGSSSSTRSYTVNIAAAVPPPAATSTLTVNLAESGGTSTASNFILTAKNGTSTIFSGSAQSSQSFVLNVGSIYSVTEATTTNSANYAIGLGSGCSGIIGTSTAICAITNTFVTAPPPVNLIANPSVESATVNPQLPDHWNKGGWGTNNAQLSYPVPGVNNGVGINVTISSYTNGDAKWYFDPVPVTPGGTYTFSDSYNANVATQLVAQYTMSGNTFSYVLLASLPSTTGWTSISQQIAVPPNVVSVTVFHLLNSVGSLTTDNFSLVLTSPPGANLFPQGIVSMTFDDGYLDHYTSAFPILKSAGMTGTFYMIPNVTLLATSTYAGSYMTVPQMLEMQVAGNDMASHAADHCDLVALLNNSSSALMSGNQGDPGVGCPDHALSVPTTAQQEINESKTELAAMGATPDNNLAYPFGSYNAAVEQLTQQGGFAAARSIDVGYNTKITNPYDLLVQNLDPTVSTSTVQSWIDTAIANKTWLILVFHQIDDQATINQNGEIYAETPQTLQAIVNYLSAKRSAGSVVVDTVGDVIANDMH